MIIKQVKEYANRQRINLNKSDGFESGQDIVLMTQSEFEEIEKNIKFLEMGMSTLKRENEVLNKQQNNLKTIVEDVLTPIQEQNQRIIDRKDNEITQLKMQIKSLETKSSQLCIDIMDLSALQLIFTDKRKVVIDDFNKSISFQMENETITDTQKIE